MGSCYSVIAKRLVRIPEHNYQRETANSVASKTHEQTPRTSDYGTYVVPNLGNTLSEDNKTSLVSKSLHWKTVVAKSLREGANAHGIILGTPIINSN